MAITNLNRTANMALTLVFSALCVGCASSPSLRVPIRLNSSAEIVVVRASAHLKPDGVVVAGDVRRPNLYAGVVPGHLQVIGRDTSGHVIAMASAPWGEFNSRRFRLAYFKAFLRTTNPGAISTISVEPITGMRR